MPGSYCICALLERDLDIATQSIRREHEVDCPAEFVEDQTSNEVRAVAGMGRRDSRWPVAVCPNSSRSGPIAKRWIDDVEARIKAEHVGTQGALSD